MNTNIAEWHNFITQNVKGKKTQRAINEYIDLLDSNNTVIILDFEHLSKLLGISKYNLFKIINRPTDFYHTYNIPKRSGGLREISAPRPIILNCQRWIYENILINQELHSSCKGFRKEISITHNASQHLGKKFLLKLDLKDFFPSITFNRVFSVFRKLGYTHKMSYFLASICTLEGHLPQGAATSPILSNIIAKRLDNRLNRLAQKFELTYTRYADDLSFSGNKLPIKIISYIKQIIEDEGFTVNEKRLNCCLKTKRKIITGISISSGRATIPRKNKREVRKAVYYIKKNGLFEHQKKLIQKTQFILSDY
jgi:hypothetical protein